MTVMIPQLCEHSKYYWIVYFERVNFMVCELYLNKIVLKEIIYLSAYKALTEAYQIQPNTYQVMSPLCFPYDKHVQNLKLFP